MDQCAVALLQAPRKAASGAPEDPVLRGLVQLAGDRLQRLYTERRAPAPITAALQAVIAQAMAL